ncbi:hypothetical protein EJ065_3235 [Corallococcus coralloides]|uniref:Novel STAND NTPase 5 domain-containing protein n=1 Tax=Corallococcus coralloides TaxID=184914 RepID=A0A410RSB3_CORCK|nr:ATP-binding protein [Corallococcus coralloides]QAT84799.1 hypothetical protein EJ065_3235 [Corallococcus coralloides]
MKENEKLLLSALNDERPVVLFLGQGWSTEQNTDPTLAVFTEYVGAPSQNIHSWRQLIESQSISPANMEWLSERFSRQVPSEAALSVLDLPWSAVFTTSIDPNLARRFETRGRQPESVLSIGQFARVPRSRSRPPIHFLYGRANETSPGARAPRSRMELRQRSIHAADMLNRISETTTPLGVLVIEGYISERDMLAADELLAPISLSGEMPILWFGVSSPPDSEFFSTLSQKGIIHTDERRLAEVIADLNARQLLSQAGGILPDEPGIISLANGDFVDISPALRLRVEASAAILDDSWTNIQPPTEESVRGAFERFHGDLSGSRGLIEGIASGFAIRRDFEQALKARIESALKKPSERNRVIILHGQSGTGKSIAIARAAYELRKFAKIPVLYASGRVPQATDLDDFCSEIERAKASATIILCDSNQPPRRYYDLASALRSRGRRIVLIGTSYRLERGRDKDAPDPDLVEALPEVSERELTDLTALVEKYEGTEISMPNRNAANSKHILPLLYRILSVGRSRIITGITGEARSTEEELRVRAKSTPLTKTRTALAEQLIAAGLHDGSFSLFENDEIGAQFGSDAPGRLIDYVMAAGRLNCSIPISLAIRVLSSHSAPLDWEQIRFIFWDLDLFRWEDSPAEKTELCISPRLQLEAELICRRRLADPSRELDRLIDLIEGVRPKGVDKSAELRFLLDLLQSLDRTGPRGEAYAAGYLRIARSLTKIRTENQVYDASIMLQESSFRRASLRTQSSTSKLRLDHDDTTRDSILNEAREVVELAIREIGTQKLWAGRKTKENLYVERASIYGFLAVARVKANGSSNEVWSDYLAARTAVQRAMAIDDSYFPFDVGLWTPFDIFNEAGLILSTEQRAELLADIYSVLDQVDINSLPQSQQEKFNSRKWKLGSILGDEELSQDAYQQLERSNPPLAYFLQARSMSPAIFGDAAKPPFPNDVRHAAQAAAAFLRERSHLFKNDTRCLQLMLQLEWAAATGDRLLHGERRPIPYDPGTRMRILDGARELNRAAGEDARFVLRYLEATLTWVTGDPSRAVELWRALERETEFEDASRITRRLFLADATGKPILFRGRIDKQKGRSHWLLHADGWASPIRLPEREFQNEDIQPGREIRDFAIAFNYLGPIADPASRHGGQQ